MVILEGGGVRLPGLVSILYPDRPTTMHTADSTSCGEVTSSLTASSSLAGLALAAMLLLAAPAHAQTIQWGVSAGPAFGQFEGDAAVFAGASRLGTVLPARFSGSRTAVQVGVTLRTQLTRWIAVRAALRYVQQGGVVDRERLGPADGRVNETAEFKFDYLVLPVLGEIRSPRRFAGFRPSVYAGPSFGLNVRSRVTRDYRTSRGTRTFTREVDAPSDAVSVVTGAEIAYRLPNGADVGLDLRYRRGLMDVVTRGDAAARLEAIQGGIHYVFP